MAGSLIHLFVCVAVVLRVYFVTKQTAPFLVICLLTPGNSKLLGIAQMVDALT